MRMWMLPPEWLCDRHLLGEHVELHMLAGCLRQQKSVQGYIDKGLVEIHNIHSRHEDIAKEILARGFMHQSPLPKFESFEAGLVDTQKSLADLHKRCPSCFKKRSAEKAKKG